MTPADVSLLVFVFMVLIEVNDWLYVRPREKRIRESLSRAWTCIEHISSAELPYHHLDARSIQRRQVELAAGLEALEIMPLTRRERAKIKSTKDQR